METAVRHPATEGKPPSRGRERRQSGVGTSAAENVDQTRQTVALRLSSILNPVIFFSLLGLIFLSAVPYGTVEPWWKAVFVCFVFVLWILGAIESVLGPPRERLDRQLLLPLLALVALALIQSLPIGVRSNPAIPYPTWTAISADPYQSQFFAVQLLAVTFAGALLARFTNTDRRVSILLHVIIAVAVCSAIFGVLRQTNQHNIGFGLPLLSPGLGYGQFINPNHFALMMEMAFGLILGMILASGSRREWMLVYAALLLIVWTALVLANSRGGLLAMLAQIVVAGLIFTVAVPASKAEGSLSKIRRMLRSLPARILLLIVLLFGVGLGTLWIGGAKVWLGTRRPIAEVTPSTLTLRPLHQFRTRVLRWKDLRGTEQMTGGDRMIVYYDTPRGLRFVALNLNLVKGRRDFVTLVDGRLREMGFAERVVERSRYLSRAGEGQS